MANLRTYDSNMSFDRLSSKLRAYAQERTILSQFTAEDAALGGKPGQTHKFSFRGNLAVPYTTVATPETTRTADNKFSTTQSSVTLAEYSTAVTYTDFAQRLEDFNERDENQKALGDWLRKTKDALVYAQLYSTKLLYTPTGTAGAAQTYTLATGGTVATEASHSVNSLDLLTMQSILADDYKCPSFEGNDKTGKVAPVYVCVGTRTTLQTIFADSTSGIPSIRSEMGWAYAGKGADAPTVRGFIGTWNGIMFIEDNFIIPKTIGSTTGGSVGPVNGELLMFGADAVATVTAMKPAIFADPPEDGGRFLRLVMRGIWANLLLWNDATNKQCRVIRVAST